MKIVILAGGTGSIALQTGLYNLLDGRVDGVDVKVIVNAYDNGLSTGKVRQVMGGRILGPSDVRKNQTTRLKLENSNSAFIKFLDTRFTLRADQVEEYCLKQIKTLCDQLDADGYSNKLGTSKWVGSVLSSAINEYFSYPVSRKTDYNDFSLSNIIYAGLAAQNSNSLRAAARVMASILQIKDNVLINDDTSYFLGARTQSGHEIEDEGDIVCWNNPKDPIVEAFFTDADGRRGNPYLNIECQNAIIEADYIILSSGTQWSSLIPTYLSYGFSYTMRQTNARIFMVMNRVPDKDAPQQSASDIIRQVSEHFPDKSLELIIDSTGHELMQKIDEDAEKRVKAVRVFDLNGNSSDAAKHDPSALARAFATSVYDNVVSAEAFVFDYDDTLVGRGNSHPLASRFNIDHLIALSSFKNIFVCSGNSIKAISISSTSVSLDPYTFEPTSKSLTVFADGGINEYEYDTTSTDEELQPWRFKGCVAPHFKFQSQGAGSAKEIISSLRAAGISPSKIENRGDVVISIRPVDSEYREVVFSLVKLLMEKYPHLEVKKTGRSTVEISHNEMGKDSTVAHIYNNIVKTGRLVYVGDEVDSGNDAAVKRVSDPDGNITIVKVRDPADTALLLLAMKGALRG